MKRTHLCLSWMRETFLLVILTIVSLGALAEDRAERLRDNLFNTPKQFTARVASGLRGGQIEVRIDSLQGEILARLDNGKYVVEEVTQEMETGINRPTPYPSRNGGEVYDLSGRRFDSSFFTHHSSLKRGLYILNGKKVVF